MLNSDFLDTRRWDAQQALAMHIRELELQARYVAAARCRAVLSSLLSGEVTRALASGALADATTADSAVAHIFAGLKWSVAREKLESPDV
jgi:hypothetical protein